jgi:hypothetical protein
MKSIQVKMENGTLIGTISLVRGGKMAGRYQAMRSAAGAPRRNKKTLKDAWKWLNQSSGGKALPLTTGEMLGYGANPEA